MDWTHVHLLLNHFPTAGMIIGLGLFIGALLTKSDDPELRTAPAPPEAAADTAATLLLLGTRPRLA